MNLKNEYDCIKKESIFDNVRLLSILVSLSISLFIYSVYWFCSWQLTIPYKFLFEINTWNFGQRLALLFGFPSYQMLVYYSLYAYKKDKDMSFPIMPLILIILLSLCVFILSSCPKY